MPVVKFRKTFIYSTVNFSDAEIDERGLWREEGGKLF